ncbi:hypothetical protein Fmac_012213 [Flemingia macrophylla]|uniref:PPM-type phosphatase domain-containing protein n=1 Tax=Flemingia macrophylla TaxID=520843 RepID=A0ABD1MPN2_9FABA
MEVEKDRILKAGGFIQVGQVNGSLNLARAIGPAKHVYTCFTNGPAKFVYFASLSTKHVFLGILLLRRNLEQSHWPRFFLCGDVAAAHLL